MSRNSCATGAARWRRRRATLRPSCPTKPASYGALVLGVRDYVRKHGFPGVVVGLSAASIPP